MGKFLKYNVLMIIIIRCKCMFFRFNLWWSNFAFLVFYSQNLNNFEIILIFDSKYNPNVILYENLLNIVNMHHLYQYTI